MIDLDAIEARAAAATPGPWSHDGDGIHEMFRGHLPNNLFAHGTFSTPQDAAFVAAARTDIPALIAHVRSLSARLAEAEGLLRKRLKSVQLMTGTNMGTVVVDREDPDVAAFLRGGEDK